MGLAAEDLMNLAQQVAEKVNHAAGRPPIDRRMVSSRPNDLQRLQALHHEILRLKLAGLKGVDIATRLGCDQVVVSYTINSTLGRAKLAMMQQMRDESAIEFGQRIQDMVPKCLDVYEKILTTEGIDLKLQKATADTIVKDLAGRAAPKQIEAKHIHAHMTPEAIESMKRRGMEAAAAAGVLVMEDYD